MIATIKKLATLTLSAGIRIAILFTASALALSGCAITPKPFTEQQHQQRAEDDLAAITKDVAPLTAPLSLQEAIARGLMYNLDAKEAMMEQTLQSSQLSLANYGMLPHLAAAAGYDTRSSFPAATSISLLTRQESLEPSYSAQKADLNANLTFTWNLLDFGLSYFQAKQQADSALAAVERRRHVMNNIVKEIQDAYWRALAAQRLLPEVEKLQKSIEDALDASEAIEQQKLEAPTKTLEYRRGLLQTVMQIKRIQANLCIAQEQLASLIGLSPGKSLTLADPTNAQQELPVVAVAMSDLQHYGIVNRPELREQAYQQRGDEQGVNREMLKMLPGLSAISSFNYDDNPLLVYRDWRDVGARASWDLINIVQGPQAIQTAKAQVELTRIKRLALTETVLAQVAISYAQYQQDIETYRTAYQLSDIEVRLLKVANDAQATDSGSKLDQIQKAAAALASKFECYRTLTDAKLAYANLLVSIGYDLVPASVDTKDLKHMTDTVDAAMLQLQGEVMHGLDTKMVAATSKTQ